MALSWVWVSMHSQFTWYVLYTRLRTKNRVLTRAAQNGDCVFAGAYRAATVREAVHGLFQRLLEEQLQPELDLSGRSRSAGDHPGRGRNTRRREDNGIRRIEVDV